MATELTPEVLAELRQRLEEKRARLRVALGMEPAPTSDPSDLVGDSGDSSVDLEEADRQFAADDVARHDLAEVEHALAKFALGTYGRCEYCDGEIPLARLRVLPEARYDAEHQALAEAQGHGGA